MAISSETEPGTVAHARMKDTGPAEPPVAGDDGIAVEEAARRLGLTRTTAYELIKRGELAAVKVGRVLRIRAQTIDEFARRRPIRPEAVACAPAAPSTLVPFGRAPRVPATGH